MKKLLCMLAIMLMTVSYSYAQEAMIKFDETSYNFGTFSEDSPIVTHEFVFQNTGNAPLVIHQAVGSCGCTIPSHTKEPVLPGEKGILKVTYNGTGRYVGHFKKSITVKSNAKNAILRLYIEGNMTPSMKENKD